jgi:putative membrane protein
MYWNSQMGVWGYVFMAVTMLLLWGTVITAIILVARSLARPQDRHNLSAGFPPPPVSRPAEEILAERFARGEIGAEEYQKSIAVLRGRSQP